MTQTTTTAEPATAPPPYLHPADLLLNLIATLLAPMFLCVTGGDVSLARMAALETVSAYRARDLTDLISIAQIIGCGLAALASLSRSMEDDLSLSMILRLRGNACALNRSAEQNRRAIRENQTADPVPHRAAAMAAPEPPSAIEQHPATTRPNAFMNDEAAKMLADEASARLLRRAEQTVDRAPDPAPSSKQAPSPNPAPSSKPIPATAQTVSEKRHQEMWAIAMASEASEITASIPGLPPTERNAASIRAGMLSSTANQLLTGANRPAPDAPMRLANKPPG